MLMHQLWSIGLGYQPDTKTVADLIGSHLEAHDEIDRLTNTTTRGHTMSADTPEGRAQERTDALDAIQEQLMTRAGMDSGPARDLADRILLAQPPRCDFDCDQCRE